MNAVLNCFAIMQQTSRQQFGPAQSATAKSILQKFSLQQSRSIHFIGLAAAAMARGSKPDLSPNGR